MITWSRQGPALVGSVTLRDGRVGKIVLVAPRDNPKGAMAVIAGTDGRPLRPVTVSDCIEALRPGDVLDMLCVQERAFGNSGLEPPDLP